MLETLILTNLIRDDEYSRKVLPFLKEEYFTTAQYRGVFGIISKFVQTHRVSPSIDALRVEAEKLSIGGQAYTDLWAVIDVVANTGKIDNTRREWLISETEQFIKQRALYLAISESIHRIDSDFATAASVPGLLKDALAVGFQTHIGHDYFEDIETRYDLYHRSETRIPFDIEHFNKITKGGLLPKTLNIIVAGTNVGKSIFLCHVAASSIAQGKNVLYITLEMAEERIARRIDANLLDVSIDTIDTMPKQMYLQAFKTLQDRQVFGKLVIKEYPTSQAHVGHFRHLVDELKTKKGFIPDILIVDYINICASSRLKGSDQTYTYVKAIAEELRGLAVELNLPCLTATQFNREGFDSSDPSLTNTSESFGIPQTADLMVALITSPELEEDGRLQAKQLKNRYADIALHRKFTIRLDKSRMRLSTDHQQPYASPSAPPPIAPSVPELVNPLDLPMSTSIFGFYPKHDATPSTINFGPSSDEDDV